VWPQSISGLSIAAAEFSWHCSSSSSSSSSTTSQREDKLTHNFIEATGYSSVCSGYGYNPGQTGGKRYRADGLATASIAAE